MREKIQIVSLGKGRSSTVSVEEIEIDYLALADALFGRVPRLCVTNGRRASRADRCRAGGPRRLCPSSN